MVGTGTDGRIGAPLAGRARRLAQAAAGAVMQAGFAAAPAAAMPPTVACIVPAGLSPADLSMAEALCAAIVRRHGAPPGSHALLPAEPDHRPEALTDAPLVVQITGIGPTRLAARLGLRRAAGVVWGAEVVTEVVDADRIPATAADQAAGALLSLPPIAAD